jgi:hypothetical protein
LQAVLKDVGQDHPYLANPRDKPGLRKAFSALSAHNVKAMLFHGSSQRTGNELRALPDTGCDANFISKEVLMSSWGLQASDPYDGADFQTFAGLEMRPEHQVNLQFSLDRGSYQFTQRFLVIPKKLMPQNYEVVLSGVFLTATGIFRKDPNAVNSPDQAYVDGEIATIGLTGALANKYRMQPDEKQRKSTLL